MVGGMGGRNGITVVGVFLCRSEWRSRDPESGDDAEEFRVRPGEVPV